MLRRIKYFLPAVCSLLILAHAWAQKPFVADGDPFGCRVFIENKGQYPDLNGERVLYALDNGHERIFFTEKGVSHDLFQIVPLTHEEREEAEHGGKPRAEKNKRAMVHMRWIRDHSPVTVTPSEKQHHYFTYGGPELNASTYKKLLFRNVFPNIDIEYVIPDTALHGIKYNVIMNRGARISDIRFKYSGDVQETLLKETGLMVTTPLEDIIEYPPVCFDQNGHRLPGDFTLRDGVGGFNVQTDDPVQQKITIDPFVVTTNTLTSNSCAYDVDYDWGGNTFLYGGWNRFKVASYNPAGLLQWVFGGQVLSQNWVSDPDWSSLNPGTYASNIGLNRILSKTYIGQGGVGAGGRLIRLNAAGNYDNFITGANNQFREVWDMGFHCTTAEVFILGGGTSSNISAARINSLLATMTLTTFQPNSTGCCQDIACHAIDDSSNLFVLYASGYSSMNLTFSNKICRVNSTFNGNTWTGPTGFSSLSEADNKSLYVGTGTVASNGFNALAVNAQYLYYYDGLNLAAYNKTSAAMVASISVPGQSLMRYGGIAVDDCNQLYLGGDGSILTYSFNGTSFSTLTPIGLSVTTTNKHVYDIKLDKVLKKLYVCGSGFAGVYNPAPTYACNTLTSLCLFSQGGISVSSTSVTCSGPGSASITAAGGIGPFSYTWLPTMQTGTAAANLNPGIHQVIVNDAGLNNTYTANIFLPPLVPLSGTVPGTLNLNCHGIFNGTAAVQNYAGGSGHQSYLWTNGTSTQTTQVASNLAPGNYTFTVTDSITACILTNTFVVTQPPALSLNVAAAASSACAGSSITLTPVISGGSPGYSYQWMNGPSAGIYHVTDVAGIHVYTLVATDSKSCNISTDITWGFC